MLLSSKQREEFVEEDVLNFQYKPESDIDEALYNEFLSHVSEEIAGGKRSRQLSSSSSFRYETTTTTTTSNNNNMIMRGVQEEPTIIEKGAPMEIIYKKKLVFGNFVSYKQDSSHSIEVQLQSDEKITLDVGQVISVWDTLADEYAPNGSDMWADVASEAIEILGRMSPRKSNLEEFWGSMERRRTQVAVDSMDLGVYIFQEHNFRKWMDPHKISSSLHVHALSAAQRYAAALLLFFDELHFKRKPTIHVSGLGSRGSLIEGGYRALDEGTVIFKQGDLFVNHFHALTSNSTHQSQITSPSSLTTFQKASVARMERALETFALAPSSARPKAATKHILKRLAVSESPSGAKQVLTKMVRDKRVVKSPSSGSSSNSLPLPKSKHIEITRWSESALEESIALTESVKAYRMTMKEKPPPKSGKRGPSGRVDLRASEHPLICVDTRRTSFFDDGFSLSPETGEIFIHIADVMETLRSFPSLREVSKERVVSLFTNQGPLHMLPPTVLDSLRLSPDDLNQVITVGMSVEFETGRLLGCRLFPGLVGRATVISTESANEVLGMFDQSGEFTKMSGIPETATRDLILAHQLIGKVIEANPWVDEHYSKTVRGTGRKAVLDRVTGTYNYQSVDLSPAGRLVNALLTLYSNSTATYCSKQDLPLPVAWEHRDRVQSSLIRRFGTQPLRSWLSQIQQMQIRASLRMNNPLSRDDCALAVTHVNNQRQQQAPLKQQSQRQEDFEAFVNHCDSLRKTTGTDDSELVFDGELINNNVVRLIEFNVQGRVAGYLSDQTHKKSNSNLPDLGNKVKVRVKRIGSGQQLTFDLVD